MKHKIIEKKNIASPYLLLDVELVPENEQEKRAIQNIESMNADTTQKDLVENYLLFGLGSQYSVVGIENQDKTRFILKASLQ